ncbi:MAG: hypothetical protein RLZZ314_398 [Bacteroidota bacterium]|jgi:hypothetical protein
MTFCVEQFSSHPMFNAGCLVGACQGLLPNSMAGQADVVAEP